MAVTRHCSEPGNEERSKPSTGVMMAIKNLAIAGFTTIRCNVVHPHQYAARNRLELGSY
jgi:hypothetical protein